MTKVGIDGALLRAGVSIDEWFVETIDKATSMARAMRIEDFEDAAAKVVTSIWSSGYLDQWDPDGGACLSTWTYRILRLRLVSERQSQGRRRSVETSVSFEFEETPAPSFDPAPEPDSGDFDSIDFVELRESVRSMSDRLHETVTSASNCHPAALFDTIAIAALSGEKASVKEMSAHFGVNSSTLGHQRRSLASTCRDAGFRDLLVA